LHANQHLPIILGAARGYEVVGNPMYKNIAENFWNYVYYNRTYATGGSNGGNGTFDATNEHWGDPGRLSATLLNNNQEFCTTYNILKVVRYLITWSAETKYMDHYERAYVNGLLGTIHPKQHGVMLYNYPLGTGYTKAESFYGWGTPFDSFWCCYATHIEQWAKMGDSIYFYTSDDNDLYVSLYVASVLKWTNRSLTITQDTGFPEEEGSTFIISTPYPQEFAIHFRIPYWIEPNGSILVNGVDQNIPMIPTSFAVLNQTWNNGDVIRVNFPMALHAHPMNDRPDMKAIMYGPVVLAGLTSTDQTFYTSNLTECIIPKPGAVLEFTAILTSDGSQTMDMIPLYDVVEERYGVYFFFPDD